MIRDEIIEKILSLNDSESGGDNALDGFEFQVSSAIYLIFEELELENEFSLIYEKIEDYIIFTNSINLYQAKSINKNLTPHVLYTSKKKCKNDNSGLSIFEKMNDNYCRIKDLFSDQNIYSILVLCENIKFSATKLKTKIEQKNKRILNFNNLQNEIKDEIIDNTKFSNYDWENFKAIRLIPKSRHEEVTRAYIEDVIYKLVGKNQINSIALYNAIADEIRRIRKLKETLRSKFLLSQIALFARIDDYISYKDCTYLLSNEDQQNLFIKDSFNILKYAILLEYDSSHNDFLRIKDYYLTNRFASIYQLLDSIHGNSTFSDICIRLHDYELKALLLLVLTKDGN